MKTTRGKALIIRDVSAGETRDDFTVSPGSSLTLVYIVRATKPTDIRASVKLLAGSKAVILGLIEGKGDAVVKLHTLQHHAAAGTTSSLLVKSVLLDAAACLYDGSIVVDKKAQRTDAYQRNENLLLGESARAVSSPVLEIQANDVRCTHGAIVKTLDPSEMWYLASRGIGEPVARAMIAAGFLASALTLVDDPHERDQIAGRAGI